MTTLTTNNNKKIKVRSHNLPILPILYSNLLYKMAHYLLDTQYYTFIGVFFPLGVVELLPRPLSRPSRRVDYKDK